MSNNFGYLDIILLAMIAGFIILRLRNILGSKTGHQDKVYSNFNEKEFANLKILDQKTSKKSPEEFDNSEKNNFSKALKLHMKI